MHVIKIKTTDIVSMKSTLIGGILLDCFNNQDNDAVVLALKNDQVFEITLTSNTLKKPKARLIRQLSSPINDIIITTVLGKPIVVFVIGNDEFDFDISPKEINHQMRYDELWQAEDDTINLSNYKNYLPGYHLSNYEVIKEKLEQGIDIPTHGLYQEFITPTGTLAIVPGKSVQDGSDQVLFFEEIVS